MKLEELMIGDWVYNYVANITFKVYPQFFSQWYNKPEQFDATIHPVPITPEILEKNGFESTYAPSEKVCKHNGYEVWLDNEGEKYWANIKKDEYYFEGYIKFVHHLQHALRLCGIEKEITL